LMLAPIAERQRRPEHALWREFDLARPYILGALLMRPRAPYRYCRGYASGGCRVRLTSHSGPRPARAPSAPRALLKPPIPTTGATRSRTSSTPTRWRPTCASSWPTVRNGRDAHPTLPQVGTNRSGWPKSARALAGRLRRAQTFLRTLGIEIVFGREGRFGTRTIRITAIGENKLHDTVSTVSSVSDNGHGAGLNNPQPRLEQAL